MVHAPGAGGYSLLAGRTPVVDAVQARRRMVDGLAAQGVLHDARVRDALLEVPREAFTEVSPYEDAPQPIGAGQTISAPHMVAIMAEALDARPGQRILEVGGGSGYHAAILAKLCAPGRVVCIEIVPELARHAREALRRIGTTNVDVVDGDGSRGHPAGAPYDRISVAAGAPRVPRPLVEQLTDDGLLLVPVGPQDMQTLLAVRKDGSEVPLMAVRFVPLVGEHGWRS